MMLELGQHTIMRQDFPTRVLDTTTPFFTDYGYRSLKRAVRAIGDSLYDSKDPVVVVIMGPPKSAKKHVMFDIANRLYDGNPKRGIPGVLQRIEQEEGKLAPIDAVYWGYSFSVAKYKGILEKEKKYGEFGGDEIDAVSDNYEELVIRNIRERQGRRSLIFLKTVPVTGATIDGVFYGRNRSYTALKKLFRAEGPFNDLGYKVYCIGEVSDPDAQDQGDNVRPNLETVASKPALIARKLTKSGETILSRNTKLTRRDKRELMEYVRESANLAASEEIRLLINNLAYIMANRGRIRLNRDLFFWNDETGMWQLQNLSYQMCVTSLVMREIMESEENFGLKQRVFLGLNSHISNIVLDLRASIRNTAMARGYYPEIRKISNK